ncbi:hypothetical protein CIPAW_11G054800 [Carya illinoinensis]|uniref:Uncharacterized protein n=1 Tax=Carya illinoinensis TaxID=32201 RepID=A0A8T1NZT4_CARIL|nr:hypothetical protein CIPAW_11G054800 [Carya illinoinensis]
MDLPRRRNQNSIQSRPDLVVGPHECTLDKRQINEIQVKDKIQKIYHGSTKMRFPKPLTRKTSDVEIPSNTTRYIPLTTQTSNLIPKNSSATIQIGPIDTRKSPNKSILQLLEKSKTPNIPQHTHQKDQRPFCPKSQKIPPKAPLEARNTQPT